MPIMTRSWLINRRSRLIATVSSIVLLASESARAQTTGLGLSRTAAAIASTPLGAFIPTGPAMATSGDDKFLFGFRLQYGAQDLPLERSLTSYGLTGLLQIEGGALVAGTIGYQRGNSEICAVAGCDA